MCTPYNRERTGFSIQSISPNAIAMLANISKDTCLLPQGVNALTLSASELLQIRQTLSECPITPSSINPIDTATELAILQMKQNNSGTIVDFLSYVLERAPGARILDENLGWDNDGVWFTGDTEPSDEGAEASYPIFTNFTIPPNKQVEVTVDFVYNQRCADFGLCFYQDGTTPKWDWGSNNTRIACSYNCRDPSIYGLTTSNDREENILAPIYTYTYTCNVLYDPNNNPNITLNTILNGSMPLDTITLNDQVLTSAYRIGFCADQDNTSFRTYIKNLTININNGETIYESSLQNVIIPPF